MLAKMDLHGVSDGDSQVDGKTSLSLGDGSNTITIDDVVFGGAIKFKGGNDVDIVNIERNGNPTGSTTQFRDKFSAKLGDGDDILNIGSSSIDGLSAIFDDKVQLDGQNGHDTLVADPLIEPGGANDNVFNQTPRTNSFEV